MRRVETLLASALVGLLAVTGCAESTGWIGPRPEADGDSDVDGDSDIDPDPCGDGFCDGYENPLSCPWDCPTLCGDGFCTGYESPSSCPWDCGDPCGDGFCDRYENPSSCPWDCPDVCGDGLCTGMEDDWSCREDCGGAPPCDGSMVVAGVGCLEDEKCSFFSRDGVRWDVGCVPLRREDAAGAGERCAGISDPYFGTYDNCWGGYMCNADPSTDDFVCQKLCTERDRRECVDAYPDEAGALTRDGLCIFGLGDSMPVPGLMLCAEPSGCDPTCQGCAPDREDAGCYAVTDGVSEGTLCVDFARDLPGPGITGDGCDFINQCQPGYTCISPGECRPYCDVRGDTGCEWSACGRHEGSAEGSCVSLAELGFPSEEHADLGVCVE